MQVQEAIAELNKRSKSDIESETAWRWAARAIAALQMAERTDGAMRIHWMAQAVEYGHEAVEHAGSAGLDVLRDVHARLVGESPVLFGE